MNFSGLTPGPMVGNQVVELGAGLSFPTYFQSAAANGDVRQANFAADAGYYDLVMHRVKTDNAGIVETRLNGVLVDTTDGYSAATVDTTITIPNITLLPGENVITWTVNGKNGASFGYRHYMGFWHLDPR
jgi:hypothetical protein